MCIYHCKLHDDTTSLDSVQCKTMGWVDGGTLTKHLIADTAIPVVEDYFLLQETRKIDI